MVAQTRSMTIVTTNNEAEALLLEAQLIKRYRPAYNVLLRDDKSFPFILLREDHDFPRIQKHRGARRAKGDYYGPFASAGSVNNTLNALQKLFLLRSCTDSFFSNRDRPCLLYQIKRCSAPCVGRIDEAGYAELVGDAKAFLAGKSTAGADQARRADAGGGRGDGLRAGRDAARPAARADLHPGQRRRSTPKGVGDADIFAMAAKSGVIGIQAFFIRGGQNWGHRSFFPAHTADVPEDEVLTELPRRNSTRRCRRARTMLVDRDLAEAELLGRGAGASAPAARSSCRCRSAATRRRLIDQAKRNAEEALDRRLAESTTQAQAAARGRRSVRPGRAARPDRGLRQQPYPGHQRARRDGRRGARGLPQGPVSQVQHQGPETAPGDDFAMMREVFERRFARAQDEDPDRDARRLARSAC